MKKIFAFISFVIIGLIIWARLSPPAATDALFVQQGPDGTTTVKWRGPIDPPMARTLNRVYSQLKDESHTFRLELHSPGGNVSEGDRVIKILKQMKQDHMVITYVGSEDECLSMCVPIFLAGERRIAAPDSQWMFHEPYGVDPFSGQPTIVYQNERNISSAKFFARHYRRSVLDEAWAEELEEEWRKGDVWKTGRQLWRERSGALTELAH